MAGMSRVHHTSTPAPDTPTPTTDTLNVNLFSEQANASSLFGDLSDEAGIGDEFSWTSLMAKIDDTVWLC